jgi:GrpB-like predicted nucleotidyltransferase (UPF0157 family)
MPPLPHEPGQPVTDEELQQTTLSAVVPHNSTVNVADYDPGWPALYAREAERVRAVLGDTALRVEHVGSTSVPGLPAKPIIDMVLVVPDSTDEGAYVPPLEAAGYLLRIREPEWFEHRMLKGPVANINLHVFTVGTSEIDTMVRFRDRLRANDADRDLYARTKRELGAQVWRHVQHYANAKSDVVREIMARANAAS